MGFDCRKVVSCGEDQVRCFPSLILFVVLITFLFFCGICRRSVFGTLDMGWTRLSSSYNAFGSDFIFALSPSSPLLSISGLLSLNLGLSALILGIIPIFFIWTFVCCISHCLPALIPLSVLSHVIMSEMRAYCTPGSDLTARQRRAYNPFHPSCSSFFTYNISSELTLTHSIPHHASGFRLS